MEFTNVFTSRYFDEKKKYRRARDPIVIINTAYLRPTTKSKTAASSALAVELVP